MPYCWRQQTSDHTLNDIRTFEPSSAVPERSDTDNGSAVVIKLKTCSCAKLACIQLKRVKNEMHYTESTVSYPDPVPILQWNESSTQE